MLGVGEQSQPRPHSRAPWVPQGISWVSPGIAGEVEAIGTIRIAHVDGFGKGFVLE